MRNYYKIKNQSERTQTFETEIKSTQITKRIYKQELIIFSVIERISKYLFECKKIGPV